MIVIGKTGTALLVECTAEEWAQIGGLAPDDPAIGDSLAVADLYGICSRVRDHLDAAKKAVRATHDAADQVSRTISAIEGI